MDASVHRRRQWTKRVLAETAAQLPLAVLAGRMTDGVVILDAGANVRFCNAAFSRLVGVAVSAIVGRPIVQFIDEASRPEFATNWQHRRHGSQDAYLLTWRTHDGHVAATHVSPMPMYDERGRFDGSLAIVVGATQDESLANELSVARAIIAGTSVVLYRARLEEGFPIEYVSGGVSRLGYAPEDLINGRVTLRDLIHADDYGRIMDELAVHIANSDREFVQAYRVIAASGATLHVEDHVFLRRLENGAPAYLEGIVTDITERQRARDDHHRALIQTISAIAATIDKRDPYTAGHQRRVSQLSGAIAEELGLPAEQRQGIVLGALIHDVGKLAVPVDILARPGRLSPEEFALVKTHVRVGVDVIQGVNFPWPIAEMIAQHHERLDGSGYPTGLSGDAICLEARIIAVADVLESMSTHRPYRPALGLEVALAEVSRGRGRQFDADVVDACHRVVERRKTSGGDFWGRTEQSAPDVPSNESCRNSQHDAGRD
jgi:PAS domain S-box-containing protein/putative nucleotidyltransferase with HDIG domain